MILAAGSAPQVRDKGLHICNMSLITQSLLLPSFIFSERVHSILQWQSRLPYVDVILGHIDVIFWTTIIQKGLVLSFGMFSTSWSSLLAWDFLVISHQGLNNLYCFWGKSRSVMCCHVLYIKSGTTASRLYAVPGSKSNSLSKGCQVVVFFILLPLTGEPLSASCSRLDAAPRCRKAT